MKQLFTKYFNPYLKFEKETEGLFQKDYIEKSLFAIRFGLLLAAALYSVFGFLDVWIVPQTKHIAWFIRFSIVVPLFFLVFLFSFHEKFKKYNQIIIAAVMTIAGYGIVAMIAFSKPDELGYKFYYAGLMLVIFATYTFLRLQFWYALISSFLIVCGYEFVAIYFQDFLSGNFSDEKMQIFVNNNFFFLSGNILGLSASYGIEILFRNEFKQNLKIENKKKAVEKINGLLNQKNAEIEAQHQIVSTQKKELTDSILYAKRIQSAVLPNPELVSQLLPEHFILFKPRDIVSGDFYFVKQIRDLAFIVAADCTGHGVPGAFMSMLCIAFLNDLTQNSEINNASKLLDELRNQIKNSLQQTGIKGEQQDGMDISLCILNTKTHEMSYAGAYHPCWIYRKKITFDTATEIEFIELPADRMPVGVYIKEMKFTEHKIQLQRGDIFYIFSDGYASQFGGEKSGKFKTRQLRETLLKIQNANMKTQKHILEQTLTNWQGENEQVDDILVIGVQITS